MSTGLGKSDLAGILMLWKDLGALIDFKLHMSQGLALIL